MTWAKRVAWGVGVAAAGLSLAHAFPPMDWDAFAWIAVVPLLVLAIARPPRAAFGFGWLGGFFFFLGLLRWLNFTFRTYSAIPWPLTWGPTTLLAGYCALWFGAVMAVVAWTSRRRGPSFALAVAPFAWVAAEWGRGHLMGGFPWGLIAYSQHQRLPVIQVAELGGVYAVSFVLLAVNAAVAASIVLPFKRAAGALALAGALVAATVGFGTWRLREGDPAGEVAVAVMQPAIEQPLKWDERYKLKTIETYFGLTGRLAPAQAQLVVWPETAAPTILPKDAGLLSALRDLSARVAAPLVVGSVDVEARDGGEVLRNTAFLLTERGIDGRYDKMHLVPFGEYVPLAAVIGFVRGWAEFISEMEPGSRAVVFQGPPAPFGVVICYEGIFPELYRDFVKGGARLMINITNDAWFGRTSGPFQHLAMYPFRAVEHRTALARSANTGVSAFIMPSGRVTRRLGLFEPGIMLERLPLASRQTLYTRLGDWLAYLSLAVTGAGLALAWRRA